MLQRWKRRKLEAAFQVALEADEKLEAERLLSVLRDTHGDDETSRFFQAVLHARQNKLAEARALFVELCTSTPLNDVYWLYAAEAHFAAGDMPAAQQALSESLRLDPHNLRSLYLQGRICLANGDEERGEMFFERVLIQDKTFFYTRLLALGELQRLPMKAV